MKKNIGIFVVALFVLFSVNSFAASEMVVLKSFYVGQFKLNLANWDSAMETQLLSELSGLPEVRGFKVFGHTDSSGPESFNQKLSFERAQLVAQKVSKISPDAQVEFFGKTFKPEEGQKVDYRMVLVEVYAEPQVVVSEIMDSLENLTVMIKEIKERPESRIEVQKEVVDLSSLENSLKSISQSIVDLKSSQLDLSALTSEENASLALVEQIYNGLNISFLELQTEQDAMFEYLRKENEEIKQSINQTNQNVSVLVDMMNKPSFNPWHLLMWLVPFLALLIIILALISKRSKKEASVFEWIEVRVNGKIEKIFSVKCFLEGDIYISPIRDMKFETERDLKRSLRSDLTNFLKEEKSESYVVNSIDEIINHLLSIGDIKEVTD